MPLLGGHMFFSFLHVMLPLQGFLYKWLGYEHNFLDYLIRQHVLIMLMNLLVKLSQTITNVGINIKHPIAHTYT